MIMVLVFLKECELSRQIHTTKVGREILGTAWLLLAVGYHASIISINAFLH